MPKVYSLFTRPATGGALRHTREIAARDLAREIAPLRGDFLVADGTRQVVARIDGRQTTDARSSR